MAPSLRFEASGKGSRIKWFARLSVRRRLSYNKAPQPGRKVLREDDALTASLPFFSSSLGFFSVEYGIDDDSDDPEDQARVLRRTGAMHLSCTQRVHASAPDNRAFRRPAKSAPTQQIGSASATHAGAHALAGPTSVETEVRYVQYFSQIAVIPTKCRSTRHHDQWRASKLTQCIYQGAITGRYNRVEPLNCFSPPSRYSTRCTAAFQ